LQQKKDKNKEDEDLNFFKSLLPHIRRFSAYDKMEYRMKVMKLTQDFLESSENPYPFTSNNFQSTATSFYNEAERNFNLSESDPNLFRTFHSFK
jgi:hypothetical protein